MTSIKTNNWPTFLQKSDFTSSQAHIHSFEVQCGCVQINFGCNARIRNSQLFTIISSSFKLVGKPSFKHFQYNLPSLKGFVQGNVYLKLIFYTFLYLSTFDDGSPSKHLQPCNCNLPCRNHPTMKSPKTCMFFPTGFLHGLMKYKYTTHNSHICNSPCETHS